jgi:hypothetical protein
MPIRSAVREATGWVSSPLARYVVRVDARPTSSPRSPDRRSATPPAAPGSAGCGCTTSRSRGRPAPHRPRNPPSSTAHHMRSRNAAPATPRARVGQRVPADADVTSQRIRNPGERLHPGLRIQALEAADHGHPVEQRNMADPNPDKAIRQVRRQIVRPPLRHRRRTDRTRHHDLLSPRRRYPDHRQANEDRDAAADAKQYGRAWRRRVLAAVKRTSVRSRRSTRGHRSS